MNVNEVAFARELIGAGRPERALEVLAAVLASSPDNSEALRLASTACVTVGRTADGIRFAESALRLEPDNDATLQALAWAVSIHGYDTARALRLAGELVARRPDDPAALSFLAEVAAIARDRSKSFLRAARKAVALAPNDPAAHHALGSLWFARAQFGRARHEFRETLRLDPTHHAAEHNLAVIRSGGIDMLGGARDLV